MTVSISPWWLLVLAVPVLLIGERLHRRIALLARFNLPVSVIGGLAIALVVLALRLSGGPVIGLKTGVTAGWWTWLVTPEVDWFARPEKNITQPFLVGFFTCIGLNATWSVLKGGSRPLLVLLFVATILAVVQNVVGISVAKMVGASPLLGIVCGALTLTGGHATALGFAPTFVKAGFPAAASVGAAAATFGLIAAGLVAAPTATWIIRRFGLATPLAPTTAAATAMTAPKKVAGFVEQVRRFFAFGRTAVVHLLVLLACVKAGAWVWYWMQKAGVVFPIFMGALFVGLAVRNVAEAVRPGWLRTEVFDRLASILLGLFLAITLASLNLGDLASVAGPMLLILLAQVVVMVIFARWVTWPAVGRDYEGAIMTAGHIGFGLGNTATAVASMDALTNRYGPAPKAYTVVPPTGGFLIDLTNAIVITVFLNFVSA
jgi:ESS family glutamate:Na+ symporter